MNLLRHITRLAIQIAVVLLLVAAMTIALRYWFKGKPFRDLGPEIDRTIETLENAARTTPEARRLDLLTLAGEAHLLKLDYRKQQKKRIAHKGPELRRRLDAIRDNFDAFQAGEDILDERRGAVLTGYLSPIDDAIQYFSLNLPKAYGPHRAWPLLLRLHGHGWFRRFQGHPVKGLSGAITAAPYGRGPSDYMYIGELDVLHVVDALAARFNVDRDRVMMIGNSMGGTGSWNLAVHYPDRFSAISPQAANASDRAWTHRWGWNEWPTPAQEAVRRYMTAINSPATFAENLLHVPAYCIHGSADHVVPVDHARIIVERLRNELNYTVTYREFLGSGHGGFPRWIQDERIGFLGAHWRPPAPETVRLKTAKLRHGRAYWVQVVQLAEPMTIAEVEARIVDRRTVEVSARGVGRLRLDPPPSRVDRSEEVVVAINNEKAWRGVLGFEPIELARVAPGQWRRADPFGPSDIVKRPGLEGPVDEVLLDPFLVVYGTGDLYEGIAREALTERAGDGGVTDLDKESDDEALGWSHREALAFCREWKRRFGAWPRLKADIAVTDADADRYNLVLFGHPDANRVLGWMAEDLPVRFEPSGITFDGQTYMGDDVGTIFCAPNPHRPNRLVAVFAANSPQALYQVNARFGNWFNWGIYDTRKWFDAAIFDARSHNPETYRRVGFFGNGWTTDGGRFFDGIEPIRALSPPQQVPRYREIPDGVERLNLTELYPDGIDQMRGAVGFDRSFRGYALKIGEETYEHGLGVRAPSAVTWEIGGRFARFAATVGLQDEPFESFPPERAEKLKTKFVVIGDGKVLWESKPLTIEEPGPVEAAVDIRGVERLTLKTRPAGGPLWLHGSSAWIAPRVMR